MPEASAQAAQRWPTSRDFHAQEFTEKGVWNKKKKKKLNHVVGENAWLMREVGEQWEEWFKPAYGLHAITVNSSN